MECPECQSSHIRKNGIKRGKQNHICMGCGRQFVVRNEIRNKYSDEFKRDCLKMYVNGMGSSGIERVKGGHHTTVMTCVKQVGGVLPDAYAPDTIPQVGELDELETFVGSKKIWIWTAVDHFKKGILGWIIGDYSAKTFEPLWAIVATWQCFFYVTDGWSVYPAFIPSGDQIISKIYRTCLTSYSEAESRFIISLTKQRFIFVIALASVLS